MAPIVYLKKELNFTMGEWSKLPDKDKAELKEYAVAEMNLLGIEVK